MLLVSAKEPIEPGVRVNQNVNNRHQTRQAPLSSGLLLDHHCKQPGNEAHPDLDLKSIPAISQEVFEREVLLQPLEQCLDLLASSE